MYDIEIADSQEILFVDRAFLRKVARMALEEEGVASAKISLALLDDGAIRQLNRQYLGHDCPTDVLSFLLESETAKLPVENVDPDGDDCRRTAGRIEGEVVISTETAQRVSQEYGWSAQNELALYLVHGLLHLVGYDDRSEDEQRLMRSREREILKLFDLVPRYHEPEQTRVVSGENVSREELSGADS